MKKTVHQMTCDFCKKEEIVGQDGLSPWIMTEVWGANHSLGYRHFCSYKCASEWFSGKYYEEWLVAEVSK